MSDFSALWTDAVAVYEKNTKRKIDSNNTFSQFTSLNELHDAILNDNVAFEKHRDRHRRVYKGLTNAISPLLPVLQLAQAGVGATPFAPLCNVLGASVFLFEACQKVSATFDGVEELFDRIADVTKRLNEDNLQLLEDSLKTKIVDTFAYVLEVIGIAEKVIRDRRFKTWLRSTFLQDTQISDAIQKLQRYIEQEINLRTTLTYRSVKELQSETKIVQDGIGDIKYAVDEVLAGQHQSRQQAFSEADARLLFENLHTKAMDDMLRYHLKNVEGLAKGTGNWLRDDPVYQLWESDKIHLLWVFGKPGVGKTMLAARTIESLQQKAPRTGKAVHASIAYVYLSHDILCPSTELMKSIVCQIVEVDDNFKQHVLQCIKNDRKCLMSARKIWETFLLAFFVGTGRRTSRLNSAVIVVDGLDEISEEERVKFLACFADLLSLQSPGRSNLRIAIFCRHEVRADPGFERIAISNLQQAIEVKSESNSEDLKRYIKGRLTDVEVLKALKHRKPNAEYQKLAWDIYQITQERAQGMFLWVKLVIDQIRKAPSPESVRMSLEQAPVGLDQMLHHVLKRLSDEEHQSHLNRLLAWTFSAIRPLTTAELYLLIWIDSSEHYVTLASDLKFRYSSLFDVDPWIEEEIDVVEPVDNKSDDDQPVPNPVSDDDDLDFLDREFDTVEVVEDTESIEILDRHEIINIRSATPNPEVTKVSGSLLERPDFIQGEITVRFAHARIGDYLSIEGNPATRRFYDCGAVPDDLEGFQLTATKICIKVMMISSSTEAGDEDLVNYADTCWARHLGRLEYSKASRSDQVSIAKELVDLFYDGSALRRSARREYHDFVTTWFSTNDYTTIVRRIIGESIDELDVKKQAWARDAVQSVRTLFQPLMRECAEQWLKKDGWDDSRYRDRSPEDFLLLFIYQSINEEGKHSYWKAPELIKCSELDSDQIIHCANETNIPKSEHWYTSVAWILLAPWNDTSTDLAIAYFQRALEISPDGWTALEGLATCYGDRKLDYEKAVDTMEDALRCLPAKLDWLTHYLLTNSAHWLYLSGKSESIVVARRAFIAGKDTTWNPASASGRSIPNSIKLYFDALYKEQAYNEIKNLCEELASTSTLWPEYSLLSIFLLYQHYPKSKVTGLFEKIGEISKELKNAEVIEIVRSSVKEACQNSVELNLWEYRIELIVSGSDFLAKQGYLEDSICLLDDLITLLDQSDEESPTTRLFREKAADRLSHLLLEKAVNAHGKGLDTSKVIQRLRYLATHGEGKNWKYRASKPALTLGKYLREFAKDEERSWRACIESSIDLGLSWASSGGSDFGAFALLGYALLFAGDVRNAAIALGYTLKPIKQVQERRTTIREEQKEQEEKHPIVNIACEDSSPHLRGDSPIDQSTPHLEQQSTSHSQESPRSTSSQEKDQIQQQQQVGDEEVASANSEHSDTPHSNNRLVWQCDGCDNDLIQTCRELYFCTFCRDVCFCQDCIRLFRNNTLPVHICSKEHEHLQVYPLTEDARMIVDAALDGDELPLKKWLDEIRRNWEIPK